MVALLLRAHDNLATGGSGQELRLGRAGGVDWRASAALCSGAGGDSGWFAAATRHPVVGGMAKTDGQQQRQVGPEAAMAPRRQGRWQPIYYETDRLGPRLLPA